MKNKQTDAAEIDNKAETLFPSEPKVTAKKRQLRKKKMDRSTCREALVMQMLQKAMEALEAMDVSTLSASNIVHLLEIAAKLEKISGEPGEEGSAQTLPEPVQIYLPDNGRSKLP